jgi:anti-anti-sigma factor
LDDQQGGSRVIADLFGVASYAFDGGLVVVLRGELDASTVRNLAERLTGPPGSLVVVDLCQLTFIDSSGLGAIHVARRRALASGGDLVLCRPTPSVSRVLEITGLNIWVTNWDSAWGDARTEWTSTISVTPTERAST